MKLYYIDDSFFQNSHFSRQMLYRFECYMKRCGRGAVLISSSKKDNVDLEHFCINHTDCSILMSPALFDIEGVRGQLHASFLAVEDFPSMQAYSGSFVLYDTETKQCERIYLELFVDYDGDLSLALEKMQDMLAESLHAAKKTNIMN